MTIYTKLFGTCVFSVPRPVTNKVAKVEATSKKTILRKLSDDQRFVDNRQIVDIPMDDDVTYQWKFMKVQTPAATENEPRYISLAYSINPQDLPTSLPDGCLLLYDGVVHCLPHDHSFSQPIILSFMLPESVNFSQITVMYSNTDIGHATVWRIVDNLELLPGSKNLNNRESSLFQNRPILLDDGRELQLILRHFCIIAILVDGKSDLLRHKESAACVSEDSNEYLITPDFGVSPMSSTDDEDRFTESRHKPHDFGTCPYTGYVDQHADFVVNP